MAIRAYWKGYLRLSLVTIRVELYPAAAGSSRLSLHQIHEPSGKRVRYQKVAPGIGPVDTDEIVKGYPPTSLSAMPGALLPRPRSGALNCISGARAPTMLNGRNGWFSISIPTPRSISATCATPPSSSGTC
jgi:hypothetical protein